MNYMAVRGYLWAHARVCPRTAPGYLPGVKEVYWGGERSEFPGMG